MNLHPELDDKRPATSWNAPTAQRRRLAGALAALVLAIGLAGPNAEAQTDYPVKPVKLVVGFPAGGGTDVFARVLAAMESNIRGTWPAITSCSAGADPR